MGLSVPCALATLALASCVGTQEPNIRSHRSHRPLRALHSQHHLMIRGLRNYLAHLSRTATGGSDHGRRPHLGSQKRDQEANCSL